MRQNLPIGGFKFITDENEINEICKDLFKTYPKPEFFNQNFVDNENFDYTADNRIITAYEPPSNETSTGYFLEVDLEYPSDLHDEHINLPLA